MTKILYEKNNSDLSIILLGKQNVGKSSLFNKLIKNNYSLISDNNQSFTIDIKYNYLYLKNKKIKIIDTASFPDKKNILYKKIFEKINFYINISNIIFFILDINLNITKNDIYLLNYINKFNKKILIIFNKIDLLKDNKFIYNFNINRFKNNEIIYISSFSKKSINNLVKKIKNYLLIYKKNNLNKNDINYYNNNEVVKISILGKQNVGKSTLINSIINFNRLIVSNIPGTTKDSIDVDFILNNKKYIITDNCGINNISTLENFDKNNNKKLFLLVKKNILKSNIILILIDISKDISKNDFLIINYIIKLKKILIIVFNKIDLLSKKELLKIKTYLINKLTYINYINNIFISALYKKNISKIIKEIKNINFNLYNINIKDKLLNKILNNIKKYNKPISLIKNKIIKIKFCKIISKNPIKILIFGKNLNLLKKEYKKYIINSFYKLLNYKNIPIYIKYKNYKLN